MASLTATPPSPKVGQPVVFAGDGFKPSTPCYLSIDQESWTAQINSDPGGAFGSTDIADHAAATLTVTGQPVAAETVVIGAVTYTWRASVGATANEVLIGADAATSLANLKAAINLEAGSGTLYGSSTVVHPTVQAFNIDATHLYLRAKTGGTAGNSLASTETMTNGSFGGATFSGGSAATGVVDVSWTPTKEGTYTARAVDDGTNTATCKVQVWSE